ncbi:alpha-L-fucosidase [Solilutibacter silvestris]|uniref:alpha-L-fucosidase n=1 Tax=Solilutibacter silvestris TaxID=1645665 RepID=A0A2K1Q0Z8_9GAMM|nr:alpha-L-fucosidase [Lysobacter silvestris]PNS08710.1 Alpha-L-fucosidase [Lysobacter silvestris]
MACISRLHWHPLFAALLAIATLAPLTAAAENPAPAPPVETAAHKAERMQWFADAKLGIFIHWGIYAVNGIDESWSFFNGKISHADYMKQLAGFSASNYNAQAWADAIKRSGARYAVLTTRHHDGVALWDSKQGINVVRESPAKRDLVGPFVKALRKDDLKVGLYYSLPDWSYSDYDVFTRKEKRYDSKQDPARWQRYLDYYQGQIADLQHRYNPDLVWFDGDWEHSASEWQSPKLRADMRARNPHIIINSRLNEYGDYATPELGLPVLKPAQPYWELCLTMNKSWGYQPRDNDYKTPNQVLQIFVQTIAMGGNLLLDIGPKPDGSIDPRQTDILAALGRWTGKHAEAIYGSHAGIGLDHYAGASTLSKDRKTIYLFLTGQPNGDVLVKGLVNKVVRARVIGGGQAVATKVVGKYDWSKQPGLLFLTVPRAAIDRDITVIALELDAPVKLYEEESKPIESNG